MLYLFKLTRSQHMALVSLLGERLVDNPRFTDVTESAEGTTTTAEDLFQIAMQLEPSIVGYTISLGEHGACITCHVCGKTSWNRNDVEQRYCGHCHVVHHDGLPKSAPL